MQCFNLIAETNENTVVAEYTPESSRSEAYQSEAALEREFIRMLSTQGYEYIKIHNEAALISNLRQQLELINSYTFTDNEWQRFLSIKYSECKRRHSRKDEEDTDRPCTEPI